MTVPEIDLMSGCLPIPVAQMDEGFFWTRTGMLEGVSPEEGLQFIRGELSLEREAELAAKIEKARDALIAADVPGVQDWMSARRARS